MSSTVKPALASLIPDCHRVNSHTLKLHPNEPRADFLGRCAAWRGNVPQQPQDAYPETALQEPSSVGGIIEYHEMLLITKLDGSLLSSPILGDHSR